MRMLLLGETLGVLTPRHLYPRHLIHWRKRQRLPFSLPDKPPSGPSTPTSPNLSNSVSSRSPPSPLSSDKTVFVGDDNVPLEGVIQFDKPKSTFTKVDKWGRIALLAGGDVLALLAFSAIGRYSHGLPVFDYETLKTTDPFIAGWFLGAYLLGGYGEDGRGLNGFSKAITAAAKSWALGIPVGLTIRALTAGHVPPYTFVLVTLGTTGVLLTTWRALVAKLLAVDPSKKSDDYKSGSPFELFELLTSLVRRW